jgi:hypothetical protein
LHVQNPALGEISDEHPRFRDRVKERLFRPIIESAKKIIDDRGYLEDEGICCAAGLGDHKRRISPDRLDWSQTILENGPDVVLAA